MKKVKSIIFLFAVILNIIPAFIYRLVVGELSGDGNLIYAIFFIVTIITILLYIPVLMTNKIRILKISLYLPAIVHFIIGTFIIVKAINEDGEFYLSNMFYAYTYFVLNIVYARVVYKIYIEMRSPC